MEVDRRGADLQPDHGGVGLHVAGRFVKLNPLSWEVHISMRAGLYVCALPVQYFDLQ